MNAGARPAGAEGGAAERRGRERAEERGGALQHLAERARRGAGSIQRGAGCLLCSACQAAPRLPQ